MEALLWVALFYRRKNSTRYFPKPQVPDPVPGEPPCPWEELLNHFIQAGKTVKYVGQGVVQEQGWELRPTAHWGGISVCSTRKTETSVPSG